MSPRSYCTPKNRAGFIIATYEGLKIDWGYITRVVIREQFHEVKNGKPMKSIIAQWLTVLCPMPLATKGRKIQVKEKGQMLAASGDQA